MSARSDFLFTDAVSGLKYRGSGWGGGGAETDWHEHTASKQGAWGEHTQRSRDAIYCCHHTAGSARSNVCFPPWSQTRWTLRKDPLTKLLPKPVGSGAENNVAHWEKSPQCFAFVSLFSAKNAVWLRWSPTPELHIPSASLREPLARVASWFCHSRREADWVNWFRPIWVLNTIRDERQRKLNKNPTNVIVFHMEQQQTQWQLKGPVCTI